MAKRIRVVVEGVQEGSLELDAATAHYVTRVHRLRVGDELTLVDLDRALEALGLITEMRGAVVVSVGPSTPGSRLGFGGLQLFQGLGKGDKIERLVRDAVALGAARLVVVQSERSVARRASGEPEQRAAKVGRWQALARDVARQCGRSNLPQIDGPFSFAEALGPSLERGVRIAMLPDSGATPLLTLLRARLSADPELGRVAGAPLQLWIGPEGGFSGAEKDALVAAGALGATMGPLVLRTEIAGSIALGICSAALLADQGPP